ncbi:MAG: DUF1552 domain-containing protein [Pirellulaceae bacterium]|jgi:hypothetical protein|nr:DUF1552 domain-containing protein [Pirellulaceae bacterium]
MTRKRTRREFIRDLGLSAAATPFIWNLPSLGYAQSPVPKQRLILVFSPNGVVPEHFWPAETGDQFTLPAILKPLEPYRDRLLTLHGVCNKVRGDGDSHMRGMSCLLTGIELFPGNIQGGSDTPAGWASGLSIDQEIRNFLQARPADRTRFGSLELGLVVPHRADPWTRWVFAGPNKPVAPVDDPYQTFERLYGRLQDQETLTSILDDVREDLQKVRRVANADDQAMLQEHESFVAAMEDQLREARQVEELADPPRLEPGVKNTNDNLPQLSRMQIDLLVRSLVCDWTRIATLQYTNSVGQARMRWLEIEESHHDLSHEPDSNAAAQEKLTKINTWYCEQVAYLVERLAATPEPGGSGSLLDNTLVVWTNELGKGNSHTLNDIPFVCVGNGLGFRMGRALRYDHATHNRLLLALAHGFGHHLETFGKPELCEGGVLPDLV